jgi:hypothetical protein
MRHSSRHLTAIHMWRWLRRYRARHYAKKCNTAFDWSDRGRTLYNAIQQPVSGVREKCVTMSVLG